MPASLPRLPIVLIQDEKESIGRAAARIQHADPKLSDRQALLRATVQVLPADRVPHALQTTPTPKMRVQLAAMAAELAKLRAVGDAPIDKSSPEAASQAAALPAEPALEQEDLADDPACLAHALVDQIFTRRPEITEALLRRTEALEQRFDALAKDVQDVGAGVRAFHGLLTRILGDLEAYGTPLAAEAARIEPAPPLVAPAAEPPTPAPLPRKPRIGLIGPLPDQAQYITRLVGEAAQVIYFEQERPINKGLAANLDYVVVTRHAKHARMREAEAILPRKQVVRIISGGIKTAAEQIKSLAASTNGIARPIDAR